MPEIALHEKDWSLLSRWQRGLGMLDKARTFQNDCSVRMQVGFAYLAPRQHDVVDHIQLKEILGLAQMLGFCNDGGHALPTLHMPMVEGVQHCIRRLDLHIWYPVSKQRHGPDISILYVDGPDISCLAWRSVLEHILKPASL